MPVPLPPFDGEAAFDVVAPDIARARRGVLDQLDAEHRKMGALCAWLADVRTPARRREIAHVVAATVVRHLSAEERYVYPGLRAALPDGDRVAERALAEDRAVLRLLAELSGTQPQDPDFDRLARAVAGRLARHVTRAANHVYGPPNDRLGYRVSARPRGTNAPRWSRLVEPVPGALDRVRDVLTGRPDYPEL